MVKRQFKTESKRILDLMVNSIYTNKEIFLRELISNASDAIDKLYFKSLTDQSVGKTRADFHIDLKIDKSGRKIIISDNGIGMTYDELDNNLGTIANSGSFGTHETKVLADGLRKGGRRKNVCRLLFPPLDDMQYSYPYIFSEADMINLLQELQSTSS